MSRVMSLKITAGRQTQWRSLKMVAPGGDVGVGGAPHCCKPLHRNAELVESTSH
jgi:hypothetical protein